MSGVLGGVARQIGNACQAAGVSQANQLVAPTEIDRELQTLFGAIADLQGVVGALRGRLGPVMYPQSPDAENVGAPMRSNSEVGQQIERSGHQVSQLAAQIRDTLDRLAV